MHGWTLFSSGLCLFFGLHLVGVSRLRDRIVTAIGERPWKGLFALLALAGLAAIVIGFRQTPYAPILYTPPLWAKYLPLLAMPFALIGFVGTYTSKDIKRITRHPMLWGVALWAASHLAANGTAPDVVLFGSFLVFSLIMQPLADAKAARKDPKSWDETKRTTSTLPYLAILQGRAGPKQGDFAVKAALHGLAAYAVVLVIHAWLLGVAIAPSLP